MKLSGRTTSSWNDIMSNGKFDHLPTKSPTDNKPPKTKTPPTQPTKTKTKPKSPYSVLMMQVETAKSKAAAIRKKKRQKTTHNGTVFLNQMSSTTAVVHDRLRIISSIAVPARDQTTITILLQPPPSVNKQPQKKHWWHQGFSHLYHQSNAVASSP